MKSDTEKLLMERRKFLKMMAAGGAGLAMMPMIAHSSSRSRVDTKAKIVVLGAGAGGLAIANRLNKRLNGAEITIVDGRKQHWYQPGFMLIGSGVRRASYSISATTDWISDGIKLVPEYATELDPEAQHVTTTSGIKLPYDYLVVASGLILNWDKVEGFDLNMVGKEGIAAVYAGPEEAEKSYQALSKFTDTGGHGLFFRPSGAIKCGAAPLKYPMIADDIARRKGNRGKMEITYAASGKGLIGIPDANKRVRELFKERDFNTLYQHVIKSVDHGKKTAVFASPEGDVEMSYDFLHVIPPQRVPDVILNSPLASEDKKWIKHGWIDVHKYTLRHGFYTNVFACGDVTSYGSKGASAVKWMVPVVEDQLVAQIQGKEGTKTYNGYAGCPIITRIGRALLVEKDFSKNLLPTFPHFMVDPLEETWAGWLVKIGMKPAYQAMLRGKG